MTRAEERGAKGAAFLDRKDEDWFKKVNLQTLNISDCSSCMLAQLSGDNNYDLGAKLIVGVIDRHGEEHAFLADHGFTSRPGLKSEYGRNNDFRRLTAAWKD